MQRKARSKYMQNNPVPITGCGRRRLEEMENPFKKKEAKRDACYYKVKAKFTRVNPETGKKGVWPSAYGSGQLVQCRKVGAANYGKSKNKK